MASKKSLLDLAETIEDKRQGPIPTSDLTDRLDLALAVLAREVTPYQAGVALSGVGYKVRGGNSGTLLAQALWTAARRGIIKITRVR